MQPRRRLFYCEADMLPTVETVTVTGGWNSALALVEYTVWLGRRPVVVTPIEATAYTWRNRLTCAPDQRIELARLRCS